MLTEAVMVMGSLRRPTYRRSFTGATRTEPGPVSTATDTGISAHYAVTRPVLLSHRKRTGWSLEPRAARIACDIAAAVLIVTAAVVAIRTVHGLRWPFDV